MSIISGNTRGSGDHQIARSLRFRASASPHLTRTPGSAGNRKLWTYSTWVKRGTIAANLGTGITAGTSANDRTFVNIGTGSDVIQTGVVIAGAVTTWLSSSALLRDPSAWYHAVVSFYAANATPAFRNRVYLNGVELTSFGTDNRSSISDTNYDISNTSAHYIGRNQQGTAFADSHTAEVNFVDGLALDATYFGQTDPVTGAWNPKKYIGTYGTNGFYLPFNDPTSTTTVGYDRQLGLTDTTKNNWTSSGISITAGVTNDSLVDTPTNYGSGSAGADVRGNFCTWNPLFAGASAPTAANLDSPSAGVARGTQNALLFNSYWELTSTGGTSTAGVVSDTDTTNTTTVASGKTYGFRLTSAGALDYINITDGGSWTSITTGLTGVQVPYTSGAASTVASLNCGQRVFAGSVPATYYSLCTQNLPDPAIKKPSGYFNSAIYTGNATNPKAITTDGSTANNALLFSPSLVWIKNRTDVSSHAIFDAVRGAQKFFTSDATTDEDTDDTQSLLSYNTVGFSIGTGANTANVNTSTKAYVSWLWKANGAGVAGTGTGNIANVVQSLDATSGVSIITYTGSSSSAAGTITHGLGVAPKFVIVKARTTTSTDTAPIVWHASLTTPTTNYLVLQTTAALAPDATMWNSTIPTTTTISLGTNAKVNTVTNTYVAYAFAEVAGFSKFGKYTGNANADGPFVYLGFRPRWVMIKSSTAVDAWLIYDAARDTYNVMPDTLVPNTTAAEAAISGIDFLSNGFKLRTITTTPNAAQTYIFAAFAENPLKYARAR